MLKARLRHAAIVTCLLVLSACQSSSPPGPGPGWPGAGLPNATIERLFSLALECVHQEYPNVLLHHLTEASDARSPQQLHPAFYGCFDWHSSVHGHWLLARLAHLFPDHDSAPAAREALFVSLTRNNIAAELSYLQAPGRKSFERPYGLAWLLQLDLELMEWAAAGEPLADRLRANLSPLVEESAQRLLAWLPKLTHPIRSGTHSQSAFAMGLLHDWASAGSGEGSMRDARETIEQQARRLYQADRACPIGYEPSGHDFLSHCLATADLLRRVMPRAEYRSWLQAFLPDIANDEQWLPTATVTDPTDGHLVHLDGLNLSRAWMLNGIASALAPSDPKLVALRRAAYAHRQAGMASIIDPHYAGGHWLGSFATYLVTDRGISQQ